jgi:flagellar hook assembly protein FlgD
MDSKTLYSVARGLLSACVLLCGDALAFTTFGTPEQISNLQGTDNFHPSVVGSPTTAGDFYVVEDSTTNASGEVDVLFFSSASSGSSWSSPLNLSNDGNANFPQIAADSLANLYVVWQDNSTGHTQVLFVKSTDAGQTWSAAINVSNDSGNAGLPHLALDSLGDIDVVWQDTTGLSETDVFFSTSADGGNTFSTPVDVSNTPNAASQYASVAVNNSTGTVYVMWQEAGSAGAVADLSSTTNGGSSFATPTSLTSVSAQGAVTAPTLALDSSSNIDFVYVAKGTSSQSSAQTFFAQLPSGSTKITTPVDIQSDTGRATGAHIFIGVDGILRVTYMDNVSHQYEAYYVESDNGGTSWSTELDVSNQVDGGVVSVLGQDAGLNVYQVWEDSQRGPFQIYGALGQSGVVYDLAVTPNPFSPNGDGVQDTTTISASFSESASWTLTITDSSNNTVLTTTGSGTSMSYVWNGQNSSGKTVSSGKYTATVSGSTASGTFPGDSITVQVSVHPTVSIYSYSATTTAFPAGDSTTLSFQFTVPATWTLSIANSSGTVEASYSDSTATGSGSETWTSVDGSGNPLPEGSYTATLTATASGKSVTKSKTLSLQGGGPQVTNFNVSPTTFDPSEGQTTTFSFTLNEECLVTIQIYNSANVLISQPDRAYYDAGNVSITWNGTGSSGTVLGSGSYTYEVFVRDKAYQKNDPFPIKGTVTID